MVREPPLWRPFALLAFGAALLVGTPLGIWMVAWLYLGAPAPGIEGRLLHAELQIFGFFATLIVGVAHHLLPRFTGRSVARERVTAWLAGGLGASLALRLAGTGSGRPDLILAAAALQTAAFAGFRVWVWRRLDPPPLAVLRRHLTTATGWILAASFVEATLRWRTLAVGLAVPDASGLRATHAMGLFGGVVGWVLGVLLRAGPMFVPSWRVPPAIARAVPWLLAVAVLIAVAGEVGDWEPATGAALAQLGEALALGTVLAVAVTGGVLKRGAGALPMLSRSPHEARIFRLAIVSAAAAAFGSAAAAALARGGAQVSLLADAVRHLMTIGFLTSMVVAMAFRLIPVLESVALPWPKLRTVAFWTLLLGVVLRSAEVLVPGAGRAITPAVALSGIAVWVALASVSANLVGAMARASRAEGESHGEP